MAVMEAKPGKGAQKHRLHIMFFPWYTTYTAECGLANRNWNSAEFALALHKAPRQ
jgi:hypothetical protein